MKSKLPPLGEIASLMPEELAPLVLQDLTSLEPSESTYFQIGSYCGQFDADIRGLARSHEERIRTQRTLIEAWSHLERLGLIAPDISQPGAVFVTRRGHEAARSADAFRQAQQRAQFPPSTFHLELRGAPYDAFVRGNFQQAISDAFRIVEVRVRDASALEGNGVPLMRAAFHEDRGPLRSDSADNAERQALAHMFAGAVGWFRNPAAHRHVPFDDVSEAIEQLMFASLLLRIVDERDSARAG